MMDKGKRIPIVFTQGADPKDISNAIGEFLIRYAPVTINTAMIIRYAGQDYNILLINTYGDNHEFTEVWTEKKELV